MQHPKRQRPSMKRWSRSPARTVAARLALVAACHAHVVDRLLGRARVPARASLAAAATGELRVGARAARRAAAPALAAVLPVERARADILVLALIENLHKAGGAAVDADAFGRQGDLLYGAKRESWIGEAAQARALARVALATHVARQAAAGCLAARVEPQVDGAERVARRIRAEAFPALCRSAGAVAGASFGALGLVAGLTRTDIGVGRVDAHAAVAGGEAGAGRLLQGGCERFRVRMDAQCAVSA